MLIPEDLVGVLLLALLPRRSGVLPLRSTSDHPGWQAVALAGSRGGKQGASWPTVPYLIPDPDAHAALLNSFFLAP